MTHILPWIFALVVAFGALAAGWRFGSRAATAALKERDSLAERFNAAIRDLAGAEERARQATELQTRFDAAIMEREAARRELAALQSQSRERERSFGEQQIGGASGRERGSQ